MRALFNKKGITLVEIIVSLAILGIILVPLSNLFTASIQNNIRSKRTLVANQLAQERIEVIRSAINKGVVILEDESINGSIFNRHYDEYNIDVTAEITRLVDANSPTKGEGKDLIPDAISINIGLSDFINIESSFEYQYYLSIGSNGDYKVDKVKLNSAGEEDGQKQEVIDDTIKDFETITNEINMLLDYDLSNYDKHINMIVENKTDKELKIFKIEGDTDISLGFIITGGNIQTYSGIKPNPGDLINDKGSLYKVKVEADFEDKTIVELTSFVTVKGN